MTPFHSRVDWGARPPRYVTRRTLTMDTAHYGGPSPWGASVDRSSLARFHATADHSRCATIVRAYQAFHLDSRGWADIAYSSLVCPHGHRYEGRGVDVRTAAQGTTIGNDTSHATCYLAGDNDPLTPQAMAAYVDESRRLRGLTKGHRDWKSTACPGDPLYRWVHSNQAVPGTPTPTPTPVPVPTEDDDMPIIISADGAPAALLSGNELVPFAKTETLAALAGAGVKRAHVHIDDYRRFNRGFAQTATVAAERLAKITDEGFAEANLRLERIQTDVGDILDDTAN